MNLIYKKLEEKISMIFQEPMTSLNPLHNIEKQITECFLLNQKSNKSKCIELLKEVGIENPAKTLSLSAPIVRWPKAKSNDCYGNS